MSLVTSKNDVDLPKNVQSGVEAHVGKQVHASTIYRLLDRHGWRKLMPRPRHPKADSAAQEQFKKTIRRRLHQYAHERKPDDHRPVILMAAAMKLASAEFVSHTDALAPPGIRPHTPQQAIRQAVYAFAAVAPQQGTHDDVGFANRRHCYDESLPTTGLSRLCHLLRHHAS